MLRAGSGRQAARDSSFDRTASERHVRRPRLQDHVKRSSAKYLSGSACNHHACGTARTARPPRLCAAKEAGIAGGSAHARNHARNDRRGERVYTGPKHIQLNNRFTRYNNGYACTPTTQALEAPDARNIQNLENLMFNILPVSHIRSGSDKRGKARGCRCCGSHADSAVWRARAFGVIPSKL